jgi:uncharacterized protein YdeI (YjbR/CyaY-like superfamily)
MAAVSPELARLEFADAAAWEAWLEVNHASAPGAWLVLAKRGAPRATVTQAEAVEVALCFGWIDGQVGAIDAHFYRQRFTPRRPRSRWSALNTRRIEMLTAAGRMRPAGTAQVEAAQADGRWQAAYSQASDAVPPDLQAAIDADPRARACFATLSSQNRFALIFRVTDAKRPETRARRIQRFVEMLAAGETFH